MRTPPPTPKDIPVFTGTEKAVIGHHGGENTTLLIAPVPGSRLTSPFGIRLSPPGGGGGGDRRHRGIDLSAPPGSAVFAAGDGVVVYKGLHSTYGRYVQIRHTKRYETVYAHLNAYAQGLRLGQPVKQGQLIGSVGSTGRSTGPHLHFEVLVDGRQVDPLALKRIP